MHTKDFDFELPSELVAAYPTKLRSQARLMLVNKGQSQAFQIQEFVNIADFFARGDLIVFNDSKVIPARLRGIKATGGKVEVLISEILTDNSAWAYARANKGLKVGNRIMLPNRQEIEVVYKDNQRNLFKLQFNVSIMQVLEDIGEIPIPGYLKREQEYIDKQRYQTVYACNNGSIAAPTAGLHFDEATLYALQARGVNFGKVTLHVGGGTFLPVKTLRVQDHVMHGERVAVSENLVTKIQQTKLAGGRVIAIGTTCVRSLESAAINGELQELHGDTQLFIYPGFKFKVVDAMLTNFHLPCSSLFMLTCAFAGTSTMQLAYQYAICQRMRFYSYGDTMLIR